MFRFYAMPLYLRRRKWRLPCMRRRRTGVDLKLDGIVRHPFYAPRPKHKRFNCIAYNARIKRNAPFSNSRNSRLR